MRHRFHPTDNGNGNYYVEPTNCGRWHSMPPREPAMTRFERMYIPEPNSGCWLWTGSVSRKGYGTFSVPGNRMIYAHRFSYMTFNGALSDDDLVCHRCDVRSCVNPSHLFSGSHRDNVQDAIAKGRFAFKRRLLTSADAEKAREMRRCGMYFADIAEAFGVGATTIKRYLRNEHDTRMAAK